MARQVLLFLLVAFLNVSLILCREDYQHHISDSFSHHHRRSTPEDSVVSTKDPLSVTEGDGKPLGEIQHGYTSNSFYRNNAVPVLRIVLIVGAIIFAIIFICGILCCCSPACSKGTQKPGFILSNSSAQVATQPQQLLMHNTVPPQQLPNYPPGYTFQHMQQQYYPPDPQQFQTYQEQQQYYPPDPQQFQTYQEHQQYQHSPLYEEHHNPPVAPPPYSEKF